MSDDVRKLAFNRIMGSGSMPPDGTSEYDEWLFNRAYEAGLAAHLQPAPSVWPVCKWCHEDLIRFAQSAGKCPACGALDFMEPAPRAEGETVVCNTTS